MTATVKKFVARRRGGGAAMVCAAAPMTPGSHRAQAAVTSRASAWDGVTLAVASDVHIPTKAETDALAAAQAKRDRRAAKRLKEARACK